MIYLLTALGLTPGGSSTVHIYTNNTQNNTKFGKSAGRAPSLRVTPWHLPSTEEKNGKRTQSV